MTQDGPGRAARRPNWPLELIGEPLQIRGCPIVNAQTFVDNC